MRVKVARDKSLHRAMRSKVAERRPQCPSCLQRAPHPDQPREYWLEAFGHRRPDGEPCPGFKKLPSLAPPPPLVREQPRRTHPTITVDEWYQWFEQMKAKRPRLKRAKRSQRVLPKTNRTKHGEPPAGALLLVYQDGRLWTDLQPSDLGEMEVVAENSQERDTRPQHWGESDCKSTTGVGCG